MGGSNWEYGLGFSAKCILRQSRFAKAIAKRNGYTPRDVAVRLGLSYPFDCIRD